MIGNNPNEFSSKVTGNEIGVRKSKGKVFSVSSVSVP